MKTRLLTDRPLKKASAVTLTGFAEAPGILVLKSSSLRTAIQHAAPTTTAAFDLYENSDDQSDPKKSLNNN